ncbi:TetR/AcrR family transcriptional regulator [Auraticoccus monumenti]|uniref:DNA-binding transcriptional regulator, AcrR family n=1 Tax=Auraticoccus monumenti TaxID=675864 RepID=A0A1G7BYT0_9ACTN|nr:TetR family transcriptional regulator [Auraticoccus monumenti]SDE32217.1 DNA-binding transcriptional regulator, AcrR family [Auraticoccus monumenti]
MTQSSGEGQRSRVTARGAATRERILAAADQLILEQGVSATSLADIRAATGTSKSQIYQHFASKDDLVGAVIDRRGTFVMEDQGRRLRRLTSLRGLDLWRDALVERNAVRNGAYGCPLGSLANELADSDERARADLDALFTAWEDLLAEGLQTLRANGTLRPDADVRALATGLLAALQGGYLLAQTRRDVEPMRVALDLAIAQVRAFAVAREPGAG